MRPDLAYEEALASVTKALALDYEVGEAHSVLALLRFSHSFDWAGAEEEFKLALELSPGGADIHDHYGWMCAALERYDEALELVQRAQELDPLTHRADVASTLLRAGRNEEALQAALRAVEFEPDYPRGRSTLGWAHMKLGNVDEGLSNLQQAVKLNTGNTLYLAQLGKRTESPGRAMRPARCCDSWRRWAGSGTSHPTIWPTSTPAWERMTGRWISWSGPIRSGPGACMESRVVPVHEPPVASEVQSPARQDEPGLTGTRA